MDGVNEREGLQERVVDDCLEWSRSDKDVAIDEVVDDVEEIVVWQAAGDIEGSGEEWCCVVSCGGGGRLECIVMSIVDGMEPDAGIGMMDSGRVGDGLGGVGCDGSRHRGGWGWESKMIGRDWESLFVGMYSMLTSGSMMAWSDKCGNDNCMKEFSPWIAQPG